MNWVLMLCVLVHYDTFLVLDAVTAGPLGGVLRNVGNDVVTFQVT